MNKEDDIKNIIILLQNYEMDLTKNDLKDINSIINNAVDRTYRK